MELFFTRGGCASCLRACLGARLLPQSHQYQHSEHRFPAPSSSWRKDVVNQCLESDQYSNLSEGADRVGGQLHGDKECSFDGVTKSGRVWRKVPESGALSVTVTLSFLQHAQAKQSQLQRTCRQRDERTCWFQYISPTPPPPISLPGGDYKYNPVTPATFRQFY